VRLNLRIGAYFARNTPLTFGVYVIIRDLFATASVYIDDLVFYNVKAYENAVHKTLTV